VYGTSLEVTTGYTYDVAGNLVKSEDSDGYVYTFEYYADKIYLSPQIIPMLVPGEKANLVKKMTLTEDGNLQGTVDYTYTFDSKDRISTVRHDTSDGDVVIKTYTYFD
jgi:YD repeat-containing protein